MLKKLILAAVALVVVTIACGGFILWRYPMAVFNWTNRRALQSAGFTKSMVQTPAGSQTVWEAGSGPALVLLHGAGDHAGSWSKVAPNFTSQYHVIVPDLAGHGESEPRQGTLDVPTVVSAVDAVIASKGGGAPVTIIGNSLGAWVATLYAQSHPERVTRVIANSGGPIRGDRTDLAHLPADRADAAKLFDAVLDPGSPKPAGFVLDDVVRQAQNGPMARLARSNMDSSLLEGRLSTISTPVDLVWGESDRFVPMAYAQRMLEGIPAARLTTIPRCGHVPQQECPKTYTGVLKKVLAEAPPQPKPVAAATLKGAK